MGRTGEVPGKDRVRTREKPGKNRGRTREEPGKNQGRTTEDPGKNHGRTREELGKNRGRSGEEPGKNRGRTGRARAHFLCGREYTLCNQGIRWKGEPPRRFNRKLAAQIKKHKKLSTNRKTTLPLFDLIRRSCAAPNKAGGGAWIQRGQRGVLRGSAAMWQVAPGLTFLL